MSKDSSSKIIVKLNKVIVYLLIILGMIMLVVALAHIFWRYVLNNALTWSEELLKILLIWFALLSTTVITRKSDHIGIVVFREMMPLKVQRLLLRAVRYLMFITCIAVSIIGVQYTIKALGQYTPSLGIPYSLSYAAIPVSFIIMSIYELNHILNKNFMDSQLKEK